MSILFNEKVARMSILFRTFVTEKEMIDNLIQRHFQPAGREPHNVI